MAYQVLVTPRSFGKGSPAPLNLLQQHGITVVPNATGTLLTEEQMIAATRDVDAVILGVDPMTKRVMDHAPKLKAISKYGVGTDNIDLEAAKARGILVTRTVGANSDAVADYAFALMLAVARRVVEIDTRCRQLDWGKITSIEMCNKRLGILGLGSIGKGVAKRAQGFAMEVLAYDMYPDEAFARANGIVFASVEEIIRTCDFISVHLPLTPETQNLIGFSQFEAMKPTAVLVNTARGGVIHEEALLHALKEKQIYGAGIDVFEQEPPANRELLTLPNLIAGSHCAASTIEAVNNMGTMAAQNVIDALFKTTGATTKPLQTTF